MNATGIALSLLDLDKGKRDAIIASAVNEYLQLLYTIAADIYDSCIADYYHKYTPTAYDRHGDLSGFNLYNANETSYENLYVDIFIDSGQLLPYGKNEKRDIVLTGVMNGLRGVGSSKNAASGWPRTWVTSYPNRFSKMGGIWSSSQTTIKNILDEFVKNVMKDTNNVFWAIVSKRI